jgi:fibrillarin-like pre-rRNA processing protein
VAQRAQAQIFRENAIACLAPDGAGMLMLKIRSITQSLSTRAVLAAARRELTAGNLAPGEAVELHPFSREHLALPVSS